MTMRMMIGGYEYDYRRRIDEWWFDRWLNERLRGEWGSGLGERMMNDSEENNNRMTINF
jgi:hypothetical protein